MFGAKIFTRLRLISLGKFVQPNRSQTNQHSRFVFHRANNSIFFVKYFFKQWLNEKKQ